MSPTQTILLFSSIQKNYIVPNIQKEQAKVLCMFYNRIFNIIQVLTHNEGTTGDYGTVRETDLVEFQFLNYSALSSKDKNLISTKPLLQN
ncbi:MAG: hypothetical protein FJ218_10115 [Ignavibacteria bacterium]|nr:hypothetical protein [Ignavibacteria bacterium]